MSNANTALWGGRFGHGPSAELERLSRSEPSEFQLSPYDIEGSRAHTRELERAGVLTAAELDTIHDALDQMRSEFLGGELRPAPGDEDPHTFLERVLIERLGPWAGKIRAGRSRNDQSHNNSRLYMRDKARTMAVRVAELVDALADTAERYIASPCPGFTHLQSAQPVTFGHQLLAHAQPLIRDLARLRDWDERANWSPLGAAALAGSTFCTRPELSAAELGYAAPAENSIDAVGSRDAAAEFVFVASMVMVDVSRLSEELILWSSHQFGWIKLDDAYCTGSSIMPQKKNPDIAELARGKAGRVIGDLMAVLAVLKGLPLALNRDMQEDKRSIVDAFDTIDVVLPALAGMVRTITADEERMRNDATRGFTLATEIADFLARRGVPFSEAHDVTGAVVRRCEEEGLADVADLSDEQLAQIDSRLTPDLRQHLTIEAALAARVGHGGTAPDRVREQLSVVRRRAEEARAWVQEYAGPRFVSGDQ